MYGLPELYGDEMANAQLIANPGCYPQTAILGLAPLVVDKIFGFLEHLRTTGVSLVIVDQLVSEALALASHVHIMKKGELVFSGASSEVDEREVFQRYLGGSVA